MKALESPLLPAPTDAPSSRDQASVLRAVFNVVNTTFGTGFFLYARQFAINGICVSVCVMLCLLVLVVFSLHALADAAARSPSHLTAYPETVAFFIRRPWCARLVSGTINLYLILAASCYLGLVADQLDALLGATAPGRGVGLLIPLCVALPFSLLRSISSFALTSAFGIFVNSFVVLVLCHGAARKILEDGIAEQTAPGSGSHDSEGGDTIHRMLNLATLCTTVVFSFQCHSDAWIPAVRSLTDTRAATSVIYYSFGFVTLLYTAFGVLGALAWGKDAGADPLSDNMPSDSVSQLCRLCVILKILVSYPLLFFAARLCAGHALLADDITKPQHAVVFHAYTALFFCCSWSLAFGIHHLDALADLAAAVGGTLQMFVWPGVLWVAMHYYNVGSESNPFRSTRGHVLHLWLGSGLALAGVLVTACGVVGVVLTEL